MHLVVSLRAYGKLLDSLLAYDRLLVNLQEYAMSQLLKEVNWYEINLLTPRMAANVVHEHDLSAVGLRC